MRIRHFAVSLIGGLLVAGAAGADESVALLQQIQGSVLVNTGGDYRKASEGMNLFVGDRVMTLERSSMVLVHNDGCVSQIGENQIVSVAKDSTCEGGAAYVERQWPQQADPMVAEARRPAEGAYGYSYGYEGPSRYSTAAIVGGGALLLGAGYYLGRDDDDDDDDISGN